MLERCERPKCKDYARYGARGITVCERWHHFPFFLEDMEASFLVGASLDRIDNNGNYEPGNVKWSYPREQMNNRRVTVFMNTPWGTMARGDVSRKTGIPVDVIARRQARGWTMDRMFSPVQNMT